MDKFVFPPNQDGYTTQDPLESLLVELDGGAPRVRRDIVGAYPTVQVNWNFDKVGFNYFREFYRLTTLSGSLPFLIDLLIDDADELTEHTALFVPGSISLNRVSGQTYVVSATLRIKPNPTSSFDGIVPFVNYFGAEWEYYVDELDVIVNTDWPEVL